MQLTPQEMNLIQRLRKRERAWPRGRWLFLASGVIGFAFSMYMLIWMLRHMNFEHLELHDVLFFALFWPKCLLLFLLGMFFIVWAISDWQGNANRKLLLKLLDAQTEGEGT
jgi:hypothetical protein